MVDIWWYGQACFKIKGKGASLVIDPYSPQFTGLGLAKLDADVVCITHAHEDHNYPQGVKATGDVQPFVISGPGEYEISGVNIVGVNSFHDNKNGEERGKNTIYQILIDDVNIVHLGDLGQKQLTQNQVEALSGCDVLMVPVGGVYTIEAKDAPDIIAHLEPKIVVPMHYKTKNLKFELAPVDDFLRAMGKEKVETVTKLSVSNDRIPQELEIVVFEQNQ